MKVTSENVPSLRRANKESRDRAKNVYTLSLDCQLEGRPARFAFSRYTLFARDTKALGMFCGVDFDGE